MNKRGMELSINVVVVLIFGIVLLSMGFYFVQKIISQGNELHTDINDRIKEQIRNLYFRNGQLFAILEPHAKVQRGARAWFVIGINAAGENRQYHIITKYSEHSPVDENFQNFDSYNQKDSFFFHEFIPQGEKLLSLSKFEDRFHWLIFSPPKNIPPGEYVYDVYVCVSTTEMTNGECGAVVVDGVPQYTRQYGDLKQRIYITVQ